MKTSVVVQAGWPGLLLLLASCSGPTVVRELEEPVPNTIAVLPSDGDLIPPRGKEIVRAILGSLFEEKGYSKLDDDWIDQRLVLAGFQPWHPEWMPEDHELARFGREIGAEALLLLRGFDHGVSHATLAYSESLTGAIEVMRTSDGQVIWSVEMSDLDYGGALIDSGQLLKAFSKTIRSGGVERFAAMLLNIRKQLEELLPENPSPSPLASRPVLSSVTVHTDREEGATLRAGDLVEIEACGTPGGRALLGIKGLEVSATSSFPLAEVSDGVYRGKRRIHQRLGMSGRAVFEVVLVDAFGNASRRLEADRALEIEASRLLAPIDLELELSDAQAGTVELRWSAVEGADTYAVVRVIGDEITTFDAGEQTGFVDTLPAGTSRAQYAVAARTRGGTYGVASERQSIAVEEAR